MTVLKIKSDDILKDINVFIRAMQSNLRKVWESMSRDAGSSNHTADSNHSKTAIFKFHQLIFLLCFLVLRVKANGVESEVTRSTVVVVHVGKCWECTCLQEGDPSEDLDHWFWKSIMGIDYLRDGLKRELFTWNTHEFGDNKSNSCQHGSTSVLQFGFTEPWEPFWGTL